MDGRAFTVERLWPGPLVENWGAGGGDGGYLVVEHLASIYQALNLTFWSTSWLFL